MMERRTFLCASIAALAMPLTGEAQQVGGCPGSGFSRPNRANRASPVLSARDCASSGTLKVRILS
jgi:hypothetical protein